MPFISHDPKEYSQWKSSKGCKCGTTKHLRGKQFQRFCTEAYKNRLHSIAGAYHDVLEVKFRCNKCGDHVVYTAEKDRLGFRFECGRYELKLGASDVFPLKKQSFNEISTFCLNFNADYDKKMMCARNDNGFVQNMMNVLVFQDLFCHFHAKIEDLLDKKISAKIANVIFVLVFFVGLFSTMSLKWRPVGIWFWFMSIFFSVPYFWNNGPNVLQKH